MTDAGDPLISIILLCYNHEKFVAEAINGVFAQSYAPLDIVIVDDCSTDKTAKIVDEMLSKHPNRSVGRWICNPQNLTWWGACAAGLAAARGSFIVLSCGDDVMLPEMVAEMADVWRAEDVSLVTTNVDYIDENSNPIGRTARDCNIAADDSFETLARDGVNACCFGAAMGFEREVYSIFGLPPSYLGAFDIMLPFYANLMKGARFIRKPLLKYRVHEHNTSLSLAAAKVDDLGKLLIHERIFNGHLAHAVLMRDELDSLSLTMPARYLQLANKIGPLLDIQTVEIAKKLVKTRIELQKLGR
jgi:glycosyltransferase involved in cell wall biosynthesis